MVTLRLYTFDQYGTERHVDWSFTPLVDEDAYDIYRENEEAADGSPRRRPFDRRERRTLTLGAGLLLNSGHWSEFHRLLRAHKIEWKRSVGGVTKWVAFALDEDTKVTFERVEDITRLRRKKITLVQVSGIWFTDLENFKMAFTDEPGPLTNS